jgi:hypothetical protein
MIKVPQYEDYATMIVNCANQIQTQTCYANFYEALADTISVAKQALDLDDDQMAHVLLYLDDKVCDLLKSKRTKGPFLNVLSLY